MADIEAYMRLRAAAVAVGNLRMIVYVAQRAHKQKCQASAFDAGGLPHTIFQRHQKHGGSNRPDSV